MSFVDSHELAAPSISYCNTSVALIKNIIFSVPSLANLSLQLMKVSDQRWHFWYLGKSVKTLHSRRNNTEIYSI